MQNNDYDRLPSDERVAEMRRSIDHAVAVRDDPRIKMARRNAAGVFILSETARLRFVEADRDWLRELGIQP